MFTQNSKFENKATWRARARALRRLQKKNTQSRWPTFSPVPSTADVTTRRVLVTLSRDYSRFLRKVYAYRSFIVFL